MSCHFIYPNLETCTVARAHVHGTCSVCGDYAITYLSRWTHVGEPCAPRRSGKWVAERGGDAGVRFVAGRRASA